MTDYLATQWKQKSLWKRGSEIQAGPFCDRESAKSTVKRVCMGGGGWRGGGWSVISHLCQIFLFCYAFKRMNTSKMTEIERTGKKVFSIFIYHVLNDCKCENIYIYEYSYTGT